ncbi:MAG TPA: cytosine permease [Dehalococcoidia bacterium]|jgi:putative hydroxymethylpyrimidine transporter CytX|nr:cytosine permease [Dehalococcoidia bacterium]
MASVIERLAVRIPEDGGIEPVPAGRRTLRAFDFAVLWGDLAVSLLVMVAGSLLVPGLGTQQAILAVGVGTGIGTVLLALAGIAGSDTGVPTMVALRGPMGVRGSYLPSAINVLQLIGWAALEIIIMSQAAKALSKEYLGFSGYYFWLIFFGVIGTLMAMGGPIVVVRAWLQRFGVWIVLAASAWLTFHLFDAYDVGEIWRRDGAGGFPNFWQGVDVVVALPVSWLPLVCDYSRFARRAGQAAIGTYIGYAIANAWFFVLGLMYVQALQTDTTGFIDALVQMLLPMALGWLALIVLLFGESDEAFANIYSTAVSIQNLLPWLKQRLLALIVGAVAIAVAISIDLVQYENFLLLIGGVFVPVFGIFLADYYLLRRRRYEVAQLYGHSGEYWYTAGFSAVAIVVWACGFLLYSCAAQPPWLLEHLDYVSWVPTWATHIGGTIPGLLFSSVAYWLAARYLLLGGARRPQTVVAAG